MKHSIAPFSDPEATFEISNGAVVNHLHLPVGTDTERINLKLDRLESLARWAGAKQLMLVNADLGYERPDMMDIEQTGGGLAVAKGLKKSPKQNLNDHVYDDTNNPVRSGLLYAFTEENDRANILASYKADSLSLFFDTKGLSDKVAEHPKNKRGIVDEVVWARVLDSEIRNSILSASFNRYVNGHFFHGVLDPVLSSIFYKSVYDFVTTGEDYWAASMALGFKAIQTIAQSNRITKGEARTRDANWSAQIWTAARTDRLIASAFSAKLGGKVIKYSK